MAMKQPQKWLKQVSLIWGLANLRVINLRLSTSRWILLLKATQRCLPNEEVVVEILETVKPGKKLLNLCKDLYEKGYTLALDDYEHQAVWAHFYPYVKIIKIDVQQSSVEEIKEVKQAIAKFPHISLLAEKVETYEEYNQAVELGFEYFQGYFFSKPEMV